MINIDLIFFSFGGGKEISKQDLTGFTGVIFGFILNTKQ